MRSSKCESYSIGIDIQSQVLIRTREKLDAMESRIAELEAKLAEK